VASENPSTTVTSTLPHGEAVEDFVERVEAADVTGLERLVLFGSVARATHDPDSDIDVLAVIEDGADPTAVEERLRDLAYDVMLERNVAFSIHGTTESTFERRLDHPFFERVRSEGRIIHG
jgi:predicted nucleotidyltransferase